MGENRMRYKLKNKYKEYIVEAKDKNEALKKVDRVAYIEGRFDDYKITEICEVCNGEGVSLVFNLKTDHLEIEKCDNCKKFKSDKEAWRSVKPK